MEKGAADFVGIEPLVERTGAKLVGIAVGKQLRLVRIRGHEAVLDQRLQERGTAAEITIAPPPRRTRVAAVDRERGARLRIAPIGKDTDADIDDAVVIFGQAPADAVGADVQTKSSHCLAP